MKGPDGGNEISPQDRAALSSIGSVIDEAQKQVRDGTVDPALLKDLGMTQEQFRGFVEQYTQRLDLLRTHKSDESGGQQVGNTDGAGSKNLQGGRALDDQLLDVKGAENLTPDEIRKLRESRAAKVSPEYRKQVEDYFRSISEGAGTTPQPTSAPGK